MDLNIKHVKQPFNQPKRKPLTLEARHSLSIEVSNKIRSKLSPRIFIPRTPSYRYAAKFQHCPKDLKTTFSKREWLSNKELKSINKSSAQTADKFIERIRGKYTKKIMENSSNLSRRGICQNIKILRKNRKISPKDFKSLAVAKENLQTSLGSNTQQNFAKLPNLQNAVNVRDKAINNWANLKFNVYEKSLDLINGKKFILDDCSALSSYKPLNRDDSINNVKNLQINLMESFNKVVCNTPYGDSNKTSNEGSLCLQIAERKSVTTVKKKSCNSKLLRVKASKISNNNAKQRSKTAASKKTDSGARSKVKTISNVIELKNSVDLITSSLEKQNLATSLGKSENCMPLSPKVTINETIRANTNFIEENYTIKHEEERRTLLQVQNNKKQTEQEAENIKKPDNQKLINKDTTTNPLHPTSFTTCNKPYSRENINGTDISVKHPLGDYLKTSAIADFQDAVRSSISSIYNGSPIEQKINTDLLNLETCLGSFSKYAIQSYNDIVAQDLKTNNYIEYLRKRDIERKIPLEPSRSQISSSNEANKLTEETPKTLTIAITAEKMPTKSITFRMEDILHPKILHENDKKTITSTFSSDTNFKDPIRVNSNKATLNSKQQQTNLPEVSNIKPIDVQKNKKPIMKLRRKVTPNHLHARKQQTQSTGTCNTNERIYLNNSDSSTYTHNVIYTQAQNHYNTYFSPNSCSMNGSTGCPSSIPAQVLTTIPPSVPIVFNYSFAKENVNVSKDVMPSSESRQAYFHPISQTFNREPNEVPNEFENHFGYYSAFHGVPYFQNYYVHPAIKSKAFGTQLGTTNLHASY